MTVELITRYVKILIGFVRRLDRRLVLQHLRLQPDRRERRWPRRSRREERAHRPERRAAPRTSSEDDVVAYMLRRRRRRARSRKVTARVVGLPGDKREDREGRRPRERQKVSGRSDKKAASDDYAEIVVPRNTVFVLCDNRRRRPWTAARWGRSGLGDHRQAPMRNPKSGPKSERGARPQ